MIFQPGVIALLLGSGITLVLLSIAAVPGFKILRKWDIGSSSEEQLALERQTYLVSTLVRYSLFFEVLSAFLFIYTADDIHQLLVGAMCATGSLNANPYGFPALYAKVATLFVSAAWLAINHIDRKAEDFPLTKKKYVLLFVLIPLVFLAYFLQFRYFININPDVITSCCGVLFSEGGPGSGSSLASLPVRTMEVLFFSTALLMVSSGLAASFTGRMAYSVLLSATSAVFFFVALASVVSFISLYFYQLPSHHCPFDILQREYYYVGYPLYASLFLGCFFGVMTGVVEPFNKIASLSEALPRLQRRWALTAALAAAVFVIITLIPMVFMTFRIEGY